MRSKDEEVNMCCLDQPKTSDWFPCIYVVKMLLKVFKMLHYPVFYILAMIQTWTHDNYKLLKRVSTRVSKLQPNGQISRADILPEITTDVYELVYMSANN